MRILAILLLLMSAAPVRANEAKRLDDQILRCLRLPASAVEVHLKATFEATLDKTGRLQSIAVVSYTPHSATAATAAQQLLRSVRKCWPQGVKRSPVRFTVDLSEL